MSAVEDVAMLIVSSVRTKGWDGSVSTDAIDIKEGDEWIATLWCQDDAEAKRLAAMMRAPTPVLPQQRNRPTSEPGGCECVSCGAIFIGGPTHDLCGVCAQPATPVFDAMNLPETPAFPSLKKARGE